MAEDPHGRGLGGAREKRKSVNRLRRWRKKVEEQRISITARLSGREQTGSGVMDAGGLGTILIAAGNTRGSGEGLRVCSRIVAGCKNELTKRKAGDGRSRRRWMTLAPVREPGIVRISRTVRYLESSSGPFTFLAQCEPAYLTRDGRHRSHILRTREAAEAGT